ncbi:MAG: DNA-binding domain-containing protein [Bdellovibrionota bacterium]
MKSKALESWQVHFFSYILGLEQSFLNEITPIAKLSARDSVDIYKRGYKARLIEGMGETFEAVWWVLGDEEYIKLAGEFVGNIPSRSFDLSEYGQEFSKFLKTSPIIGEIPFISELARFEWIFKELFHSANISKVDNFLSLLGQNPDMKLRLLPSVILWRSDFSIYEIWKRRSGEVSELNELEIKMMDHILCRKIEDKVHMTHLEESELRLLEQFENPRSIDEAVTKYQSLYGELSPDAIQSLFSRIGSLGVLGF